jgi:ATP-dependent DNA helicase RecG
MPHGHEAATAKPAVDAAGAVRVEWNWKVPTGGRTLQAAGTKLTTEVIRGRRLLAALSGEITRRQLRTALGLKNHEHFPKPYLLPALEARTFEMAVPNQANSRLQQ